MAKVAGVTVDTDHWIGGERVGSAAAFTDLSPIDERPVAEVARGGAAEAEAAVAAAARAFPAWSRTSREERARILHAIADGVDKRLEELAQVETADNGALHPVPPARGHAARGAQLPLLRRLAAAARPRGLRDARPPQPRQLGPRRGLRADHPVERAADARHLEGRPRARRRQHRGAQARRVVAAHRVPARRHRRRGRAARRRVQRRAGLRRGGRRAAGRAPRRAPDQLHRLGAHGAVHRRAPRRPTSPRCRWSSAASRRCWCSPTPTSTSPSTWPSSSTTTPGRSAWPRPGCWWRRPSPRSSPSASSTKARRLRPGRPPRRGHRHRPADPPRATSSASTASSAAPPAAGARPWSGGGPQRPTSAASTTGPRCSPTSPEGAEILAEEVFGPVLTLQTFTHRGAGRRDGQRHPLRPGRHASPPATRSAPTASADALVAGTVWVNCFFVRDLRGAVRRLPRSPASAARAATGASTSTAT